MLTSILLHAVRCFVLNERKHMKSWEVCVLKGRAQSAAIWDRTWGLMRRISGRPRIVVSAAQPIGARGISVQNSTDQVANILRMGSHPSFSSLCSSGYRRHSSTMEKTESPISMVSRVFGRPSRMVRTIIHARGMLTRADSFFLMGC